MSASDKSSAQTPTLNGQGVFLAGELLAVSPGKAYTDRENVEHQPYRVKLLVGESVMSVEYADEVAAGAAIKGAMKGEPVVCAVFVQGAYDADTRRRGPVFFRGR